MTPSRAGGREFDLPQDGVGVPAARKKSVAPGTIGIRRRPEWTEFDIFLGSSPVGSRMHNAFHIITKKATTNRHVHRGGWPGAQVSVRCMLTQDIFSFPSPSRILLESVLLDPKML
jgi:hypothetical protein